MLACWLSFRFSCLCRFHIKSKLSSHVMVQLDRDLVFARVLDRTLEDDLVTIDLDTQLVFHPEHDVLRSD